MTVQSYILVSSLYVVLMQLICFQIEFLRDTIIFSLIHWSNNGLNRSAVLLSFDILRDFLDSFRENVLNCLETLYNSVEVAWQNNKKIWQFLLDFATVFEYILVSGIIYVYFLIFCFCLVFYCSRLMFTYIIAHSLVSLEQELHTSDLTVTKAIISTY